MNDDLKNLSDKLDAIQSKESESEAKQATKDNERKEQENGFGAGVELIANMIAGGIVGYGIDYLTGTQPLFTMLFFLIGFGWGLYRVYRIMEKLDNSD